MIVSEAVIEPPSRLQARLQEEALLARGVKLDDIEQRILQLAVKNRRLMGAVIQNAEAMRAAKEAVDTHKAHMRELWEHMHGIKLFQQVRSE